MNFGGTVKLNRVGVFVLLGFTFIFFLYIFAGRSTTEKNLSLKQLLIASINVAKKGGHVINKFRDVDVNMRTKGETKEGMPDVVTDADYGSHCVMYYGLRISFPALKIVSEEKHSFSECRSSADQLDGIFSIEPENDQINKLDDVFVPAKDVTVWIDPLDATQEFTEKLYQYVTTMVCVAVQGKPVIGVIHEPFAEHSTTSWVWLQYGKSSNLNLLKFESDDEHPVIIVSRSHAGNVSKVIKKSLPEATLKTAGGAGYKVLQLIKGQASAYVHTTIIKKWDICAGNAILNHLDGKLSTLDNDDIDYSETSTQAVLHGILATVGSRHNYFYQKLQQLKP